MSQQFEFSLQSKEYFFRINNCLYPVINPLAPFSLVENNAVLLLFFSFVCMLSRLSCELIEYIEA